MRTSDGVEIAVRISGPADGMPVLQLSGGPGFVNYLPDAAPDSGVRVFSPDPRGVGESTGGPHDLFRALADLEEVRLAYGIDNWLVAGHSFGADLGLAYAVEVPGVVRSLIAVCGTGVQNDRDWKAAYDELRDTEPNLGIPYSQPVHRALLASWREWIKQPQLLARLASLPVRVQFVLAEADIRPSWPVEQLAALIPGASLRVLPGVGHDFWHTDPELWRHLVADAQPPTSAS